MSEKKEKKKKIEEPVPFYAGKVALADRMVMESQYEGILEEDVLEERAEKIMEEIYEREKVEFEKKPKRKKK